MNIFSSIIINYTEQKKKKKHKRKSKFEQKKESHTDWCKLFEHYDQRTHSALIYSIEFLFEHLMNKSHNFFPGVPQILASRAASAPSDHVSSACYPRAKTCAWLFGAKTSSADYKDGARSTTGKGKEGGRVRGWMPRGWVLVAKQGCRRFIHQGYGESE